MPKLDLSTHANLWALVSSVARGKEFVGAFSNDGGDVQLRKSACFKNLAKFQLFVLGLDFTMVL